MFFVPFLSLQLHKIHSLAENFLGRQTQNTLQRKHNQQHEKQDELSKLNNNPPCL